MSLRFVFLRLHLEGLRLGMQVAGRVRRQVLLLQTTLVEVLRHADLTRSRRHAAPVLALLTPILREVIDEAYGDIARLAADESFRIAERQAQGLVAGLRRLEGSPPLAGTIDTAALGTALATTAFPSATKGTQPSALASEWWPRQAERVAQGVTDQMRAGLVADETETRLLQRLTGTHAAQEKDGLMAKVVRAAEVVAMAQAAMAITQGTMAVEAANPSEVAWLEHSSIIDDRTTEICLGRDGKRWHAGTVAPMGHQLPYAEPPLHFNCRSTMLLILRGLEDAGGIGIPRTFPAFLAQQSAADQQVVLGATLAAQWHAGTVGDRALIQAVLRRPL